MKFNYNLIEDWPPLAWAAKFSQSKVVVEVYHGKQVETNPDFFCEAVWDNDYLSGDFDLTDLVYGSGGRLRNNQVFMVSSGSTVDRLQSWTFAEGVWVSNSLACLLTVTKSTLDPANINYSAQLGSIVKGINQYQQTLDVSVGAVQFTYFNNLSWNGTVLLGIEKPQIRRKLDSFASYETFLQISLQKLASNMADTARQHSYTFMGTLSSGYDSTTNTVLAQQAGLKEVISFTEARNGAADDGKEIAQQLGLQLRLVPRSAWQEHSLAEVPFLAADGKGEDVYFRAAESYLEGKVLLTGFHGDKMWAKETYNLSPTIVRGDRSGLSLTEYRLWAGFIHLPVPFMGVRQIKDVNAISNSPEMIPWDVPGNYSRPICRRIVEQAGVPRNKFGVSKKAASVLFGSRGETLSAAARQAYNNWLQLQSKEQIRSGLKLNPGPDKSTGPLKKPLIFFLRVINRLVTLAPSPIRAKVKRLIHKMDPVKKKQNLMRYTFPWAMELAKEKYQAYFNLAGKN